MLAPRPRYPQYGTWPLWLDMGERYIAPSLTTLPPEVVAAAQERGRTRDLWATAEAVLAALESKSKTLFQE